MTDRPTAATFLNTGLAFVGTALGLLVFFLPEINKWLAVLLAFVMGAVFAPFQRRSDDIDAIIETLRYAGIAWAVVVALQQTAKLQFPTAAPNALADAAFAMIDDQHRGRLPDLNMPRLPRNPHFEAPGSYFVQPVGRTEAVALQIAPVIDRAARDRSKRVEGSLFNIGAIWLVLAVILRMVVLLLGAFGPRAPGRA